MATGNEELEQECSPKRSRMGTATMKLDKVTEESKKSEVSIERSNAGTTEKNPVGLIYPNQSTIIIINIICVNIL